MSRTFHNGERRIRVHAIKRDRADLKRLARALIELAEAEAQAEAEAKRRQRKGSHRSGGNKKQSGGNGSPEGGAQ
jgi:hypothetical protein